jgi:histidyl-tRNA synthetase
MAVVGASSIGKANAACKIHNKTSNRHGQKNMNDSKRKYKPRSISGFPELLPEERIVELRWLDTVRAAFESYGFCSIETPSVEEIPVLAAKGGDVDKEIYALRRLAGTADDADSRVALHYDLTVPLARYVAQHYANLVFPFKRYQIQRVWRGERPQEGRFREFYQCDIDIIDNNAVSIHFDAELPEIIYQILQSLNIGGVSLNINNRKILEGFYNGLGSKIPFRSSECWTSSTKLARPEFAIFSSKP